jgi:hypothetical protein
VLANLKEQYGDKVVFLSLTVEPQDTAEKIAEKVRQPSLTYARASDAAWKKLMTMGGEDAGPIPAHVFMTADGNVSKAIVGGDGVEDAVKAILP